MKGIQARKEQHSHKKNEDGEKRVYVLGDSMIKHVNGWDISKQLPRKCKVYVKSFSGAKVRCMKDYAKPSIRENPDHVILHIGTNDLNIILTVFLFCTEKYKPEVDNTDRACEVGILTEGLYFEVRIRKQLVLYLLTGRNSVNKKGFKSKSNE